MSVRATAARISSQERARGARPSRRCAWCAGRRLAVWAERPPGIDPLSARLARVLDPDEALRAAQIAALDRELAVGAGAFLELPDPKLRGADLELALVRVVEELGRAEDRVDDRADVGEERRRGGAGDEHLVADPASGREVGP